MKHSKKFMTLALAMALVIPQAHAGLLKKIIVVGAVAYGAHAVAKNYQEKKAQQQQQQNPNANYNQNYQPQGVNGNNNYNNGGYQNNTQPNNSYVNPGYTPSVRNPGR